MKTVGELREALEDYGDDDELRIHIDLFASLSPDGRGTHPVMVTVDPGLIAEVREEPATDDTSPRAACLMVGEWP